MRENNLTKASLARKLGTSRARITQVLALLDLSPTVLEKIAGIGDSMDRQVLTERRLRTIMKLSGKEQEVAMNEILCG